MRVINKMKKIAAKTELGLATMFDMDGKMASMITFLKTMHPKDFKDGKVRFWRLASPIFPNLFKVAIPLMGTHATSCASERKWSGQRIIKTSLYISVTCHAVS
jgi:hypothetical protein